MLELTSISKSFADVQVLDNLFLSVAPGSRTAIVGPSGSGKTTLLRILAGFETPDAGRIVMQGRTLFDEGFLFPPISADRFRSAGGGLFPHLNVADNIAWGWTLPAGEAPSGCGIDGDGVAGWAAGHALAA
jgi:iron(III) transport system ATP-binding protein